MSKQHSKCQTCGALAVVSEDGTRYLTIKLFRCEKCKAIRYCGTICQSEDYPRHKQECAGLAAARKEKKRARRKARKQQKQEKEQIEDDDPPQ